MFLKKVNQLVAKVKGYPGNLLPGPLVKFLVYKILNLILPERSQFVDSLGYFQTSSPAVVDTDGDGIDEVLLSMDSQVFEEREQVLNTHIVSIDFVTKKVMEFWGGCRATASPLLH